MALPSHIIAGYRRPGGPAYSVGYWDGYFQPEANLASYEPTARLQKEYRAGYKAGAWDARHGVTVALVAFDYVGSAS